MNKSNTYITLGVTLTLAGFLMLMIREDISKGLNLDKPIILTLIAGFLVLYGAGFFLFFYLQYYRKVNYNRLEPTSQRSVRSEIENLRLELYRLKKSKGKSSANHEEINSIIKKIISENLDNKNFLQLIEDKFGDNIIEENKINRVTEDFNNINERIELEINRLTKSGSINLVFGSVTTLGAIGFLGYEVIYNSVNFTELVPLLSHYIPRLALVIFVEIFAFFFLKIYKANLNDIKFFHNEKTNIDLKIIAIKSAFASQKDETINSVIKELARTERNFVLKKGDSTIELEKERINNMSNSQLLKTIKNLAN